MSATLPSQAGVPERDEGDDQRSLRALFNLIELGQGDFGLALIEFDLPRQRERVIQSLRERFANLNLVEASLTRLPPDEARSSNVLDQLTQVVAQRSPDRKPDVLLVTGLERLFDLSAEQVERPSEDLVRVLQALNLGRNLLAQQFPCPLLLFLPTPAMALFVRLAPDINSWRSGFFSFHTDRKAVEQAVQKATRESDTAETTARTRQLPEPERRAKMERIRALIADAKEIGVGEESLAQLYLKLGWSALALPDRSIALDAFGQALKMAEAHKLPQLVPSGRQGAARARKLPKPATPGTKVFLDFPGVEMVTSRTALYGRDDELWQLVAQTTSVNTRFLIVWGDTGSGKSSLVRAGLMPEVAALGSFLPIRIKGWNATEGNLVGAPERRLHAALRDTLAPEQHSDFDPLESLHDQVQYVAQKSGKTVVIVCDQFEQFFVLRKLRGEREPFLKAVGDCVRDHRIQCKFVFVIRSDYLGHLAEFDGYVPEPLGEAKRCYVPAFNIVNARQVLQRQAERVELHWSEEFIGEVVNDLKADERVSPVKLQIVSTMLALKGIQTPEDYARAGKAQGLLADYLAEALEQISDRSHTPELLKRLLLTLVVGEDSPRRQALSVEEIAKRLHKPSPFIRELLTRLQGAHLVRCTAYSMNASLPADEERFELTHDVLVDLVRAPQDPQRQANRLLERALQEHSINPRHHLKLNDLRMVHKHADTLARETPEALKLLRRSFAIGVALICLWCLAATGLAAGILFGIQQTSSHFDWEGVAYRRVVVKHGPTWLSFLPGGKAVLYDTGFIEQDFDPKKMANVYQINHWEWDTHQSSALKTLAEQHALLPSRQGLLMFQLGSKKEGIRLLLSVLTATNGPDQKQAADELQYTAHLAPEVALPPLLDLFKDKLQDSDVRQTVAFALREVAKAEPTLAQSILSPLLDFLKDKSQNNFARNVVVYALPEVAKAHPTPSMLSPLLDLLRDKTQNSDARIEVAFALEKMAKAEPTLAQSILSPLLDFLKDNTQENYVRSAVANDLPEVAKARPTPSMLSPLMDLMKDKTLNSDARTAAATALAAVVQTQPTLAPLMLSPLLDFLKDKTQDEYVRAAAVYALTRVAKARPTPSMLSPLLDLMKDKTLNSDARTAAATALAAVVQTQPALASSMLSPLLDLLKDKTLNHDAQTTAASALAEVAKVVPQLALPRLLDLMKDKKQDSSARTAAATALAAVVQAQPTLAPSILSPLLDLLKDKTLNHDAQTTAASALSAVAKVVPQLALPRLLDLMKDKKQDSSARTAAATALSAVVQTQPTLAPSMLSPLLGLLKDKTQDEYVRAAAVYALTGVAKAQPILAHSILSPLLDLLKEKPQNNFARSDAPSALAEVAKADPVLAPSLLSPLLDLLKDKALAAFERCSTVSALAEIAEADPALAPLMVFPLLDLLKDSTVRRAIIVVLPKIAKARPALAPSMLAPLLDLIKNKTLNSDAQTTAASALAEVATADSQAAGAIFGILLEDGPNEVYIISMVSDPLADAFVTFAEREANQGRASMSFFLRHLRGQNSLLLHGQNANTCAPYRRIVEQAMAQWLESKDKPGREALRQKLMEMSVEEPQLQWRIAAEQTLMLAWQLHKSAEHK